MRTARVRMPRITSQQSNGDGTAPAAFWWKRSRSSRSSRRVASRPLITSEWPERYFVAECMTTSAPSSSGRWMNGVAKVLSTTVSAPAVAAMRATALMSTTLRSGLVGVSTQTMRAGGTAGQRRAERVEVAQVDRIGLDRRIGSRPSTPGARCRRTRRRRGSAGRQARAGRGRSGSPPGPMRRPGRACRPRAPRWRPRAPARVGLPLRPYS